MTLHPKFPKCCADVIKKYETEYPHAALAKSRCKEKPQSIGLWCQKCGARIQYQGTAWNRIIQ